MRLIMDRFVAKLSFIFLLVLAFPLQAYSWNAVGHMLVATIAYERLQPKVKVKVDALTASFNKEYPGVSTFAQAALWLDELRIQKINTFTHWHYINLTLSGDGTQPIKNMIDSDNAVWAVKQIVPIVGNEKANLYERARFLAFLTHIVGDLHQPLHAVALVTAAFPTGDQGGNLYKIQHSSADNLHSLWDSGVGNFVGGTAPENITTLSHTITSHYPPEYFGDRVKNLKPDDWANEDLAIAKKSVYTTAEKQVPSTAYIENGKQIAEQQAALAGYRLAAILNQSLG